MAPPRIAIIFYSLYGHVTKLAQAEKLGIEQAGGKVDMYQVPETLPEEVLTKMKASPKPDYPVITLDKLLEYDAFMFGIPTRYGNMPGQWKASTAIVLDALWDATGKLWVAGSLAGKYVGMFVSTSTPGGGQETTGMTMMTTIVHHGMIYVPFGYSRSFAQLGNLTEVHGGSPWGAGTFSAPDSSRQPTELELEMATSQGKLFYEIVSRVQF
ncbi:hypothetical protein AX17_006159 [Amanita inopinata Kibby_2008]|nr:hypothetical protein AX17_006159 [Amanita inopinata Kibby_2008]